jgi:predicted amidophosphoribosyltransferase
MLQVKENRVVRSPGREETASAFVARRVREMHLAFANDFLGPDATLVPVPRSGLRHRGALWPANEIAVALHREGFARGVLACLERARAVPKAATSSPKDRPKARAHFESLELHDPVSLPNQITLVDDVITRGAQLFGAAWRIWAARPDVVVRAFAIIRTISDPDDFTAVGDPCEGIVEWRSEECRRVP